MDFDNSTGGRRSYDTLVSMGYTHVIIVHSEEDYLAGDFPDDAIVAWPSLFSRLLPNELNCWIKENEVGVVIDVEAFSLTYPLTIGNMIDNWEGGLELVREILSHPSGQSFWWGEFDEFSRAWALEHRILNDALETSYIDINEYGLTLPLSPSEFRSRHPTSNIPIGLELFNRLDESVQLELAAEIPYLLAEFRSALRLDAWNEKWRTWRAEQEALEGVET
jgi:hypothetical protein